MQNPQISALIAIALYLVATIDIIRHLAGNRGHKKTPFLILGFVALIFHSVFVYGIIFTPQGVHLGFFKMGALIGCLIASLAIVTAMFRPVENITVVTYPIAILAILAALLFSTDSPRNIEPGKASHIIISILAFSVLAIAAAQATILAMQEYQLKHHNFKGIINVLPPIQVTESVLFEMLAMGFILLSASILSGFFFLENMLAQHVMHKTVLTILAWFIFLGLLFGRHFLGWRGKTAIKWTIGGFTILIAAYWGSQFVLELILNRV